MKATSIIKDYYGKSFYVEKDKNKLATIFIVDDNKVFLNLIKHTIKRKNYSILTFTSGEECLDYFVLEPDLVILDFHLDASNPHAMNGDEVAKEIKKISPNTEIILVSADKRFKLFSKLKFTRKLMFKDDQFFPHLSTNVLQILINSKKDKTAKEKGYTKIIFLTFLVILSIFFIIYLLENT